MSVKVVVLEGRRAATKTEKQFFGITWIEGNTARVFVNLDKNRRSADLLDTVFHELTHAVIGLYGARVTGKREERLCRKIAEHAKEAFRNA